MIQNISENINPIPKSGNLKTYFDNGLSKLFKNKTISTEAVTKEASLSPLFKANAGLWKGLKLGSEGNLLNVPLVMLQVAAAKRGDLIPTMIGQGSSIVTFPIMTSIMSAGLCVIPGIGPGVAAFASLLLSAYPNGLLSNSLTRNIRWLSSAGLEATHIHMGGNYTDTNLAAHQRSLAKQELSRSIQASRKLLGQEAIFLHR